MTRKLKTRKYFFFIGSETQALLTQVEVLQNIWSDHAVLVGCFRGSVRSIPRTVWNRPDACPWPSDLDVSGVCWPADDCLPDAKYHKFWQNAEAAAVAQSASPIPKAALGRPVKLKTLYDVAHAPPPVGRPTDAQPLFHDISLLHSQSFRQLRTLQAYVRLTRSPRFGDLADRARSAWGSVLRGKGFRPDFATWWIHSEFRFSDAPAVIPIEPPPDLVATAIYESFNLAVRQLEKTLRSNCSSYARARRAQHPNLVFRDVKPLGADGVNLLVRPLQAQVTDVDKEALCVSLDQEIRRDDAQSLFCKGRSFRILHVEDAWIWLDSVDEITTGDVVTQLKLTGHIDELCQAFRQAWRARWHRHEAVSAEQWQTIAHFAKAHLPTIQCPYAPLDVAAFDSELRRRRSKGATGMDGVSLRDLQALPPPALEVLCSFFRRAEFEGVWPSQLLNGLVSSLAKNAQPQSPLDFRPFTALPVIYRIWGSHPAKILLRALDEVTPSTLYGSRPGCHATQVWTGLLWQLELAHIYGLPMAGIQADIQKAFNHLPRLVLMEAAAALGLPSQILLAWTAALQGLERLFQIRSFISQPVSSTNGVPEGRAMSCVGMTIVNRIFRLWFQIGLPQLTPLSYVDDWQLLSERAVDLQLVTLTCCWTGKRLLPGPSLQMNVLSCDPLAFARNIMGRFLGPMLNLHWRFPTTPSLSARSPFRISCGYDAKIRAIRAAAWPKGLHGWLAVPIGAHHFSLLRTWAVRGLQADGSGVNPHIHLGLVEHPTTDPVFWVICTCIRPVRSCACPEDLENLLGGLSNGLLDGPANGISSLLLTRLHWLGWGFTWNGHINDRFGTFSLFDTSLEEVLLRAEWAWLQVAPPWFGHFALRLADTRDTRDWLALLSPSDRGLFKKILKDAIFTANFQSKWDEPTSPECPYGLCTDGRFHRWWICEALQEYRQELSADAPKMLPSLPESLTCFGWSLLPSTWTRWQTYLAGLPEPEDPFVGPMGRSMVDVFTDGTCAHPADRSLRHCAYTCVLANAGLDTPGQIISAGVVPGLFQTAYRAQRCMHVCVWSDGLANTVFPCGCGSIVGPWFLGFSNFLNSLLPLEGILLILIFGLKSGVGYKSWSLCQSRSLRSLRMDLWLTVTLPCLIGSYSTISNAHNAAAVANFTRKPEFWNLFHEHSVAVCATRTINRQIQRVQLAVSQAITAHQIRSEQEADAPPVTCAFCARCRDIAVGSATRPGPSCPDP